MLGMDNNAIMQVAIVVKDIERVAKNYSEMFGIPMPEIIDVPPVNEVPIFYKGEKTDSRAKICVFKMGSIILELTEPDETLSGWKDFYDKHGQGVHHIGIKVNDREKAIDAFDDMGIKIDHVGYYPTSSYTFMDSMKDFGVNFNVKHDGEDNSDKLLK
jgi:4-hydroxyphenylpyruvate dioxygenase-like putative hemolysin